ncbi:MAG: hypothetical protein WDW38_009441 [Sanguina aurantia]
MAFAARSAEAMPEAELAECRPLVWLDDPLFELAKLWVKLPLGLCGEHNNARDTAGSSSSSSRVRGGHVHHQGFRA